jgi:signal peptidase I
MIRRRTWILAAVFSAMLGCGRGSWNSGDRVLVSKCSYETGISEPHRFDVVVFKYPRGPVENNTPKNYIKRLLGLPGELIALFFGRLHRWAPQPGEAPPFNDKEDPAVDARTLWQREFMHENDKLSRDWFDMGGKFEIVRKTPDIMMALRRNVYDNDFPARDMLDFPRWQPQAGNWTSDKKHGFSHDGQGEDAVDWLRYHHLVRPKEGPIAANVKRELITDFMSYNSFKQGGDFDRTPSPNWVGDLMLEAEVHATKAEGELILELSKGIHRFQARFDLGSGVCKLFKNEYQEAGEGAAKAMKQIKSTQLDSKPTRLRGPGTYQVRFANFDARLTVWVDRDLPFGNGVDYPPPEVRDLPEEADLDDVSLMHRRGPTRNDLEPASFGSRGGAVHVRHLRLWRDTYYSLIAASSDVGPEGAEFWSSPDRWTAFDSMKFKTLYVQPGHYLCMGDNSQASSDGREWGLVPERLMLGRALLVYYPFDRAGAIR